MNKLTDQFAQLIVQVPPPLLDFEPGYLRGHAQWNETWLIVGQQQATENAPYMLVGCRQPIIYTLKQLKRYIHSFLQIQYVSIAFQKAMTETLLAMIVDITKYVGKSVSVRMGFLQVIDNDDNLLIFTAYGDDPENFSYEILCVNDSNGAFRAAFSQS